jgi:hypothetical protein
MPGRKSRNLNGTALYTLRRPTAELIRRVKWSVILSRPIAIY